MFFKHNYLSFGPTPPPRILVANQGLGQDSRNEKCKVILVVTGRGRSNLSSKKIHWTDLRSTSIQEVEEGFRFLHLVPRSLGLFKGGKGRLQSSPPNKSTQVMDFYGPPCPAVKDDFLFKKSHEFVIAGLSSFP